MFSASCVGISFGWITPLMKQGYRKPVTEKDVWKLDKWDEAETLTEKFVFFFSMLTIWFYEILTPYMHN